MKKNIILIAVALNIIIPAALAEAPVVDVSQNNVPSATISTPANSAGEKQMQRANSVPSPDTIKTDQVQDTTSETTKQAPVTSITASPSQNQIQVPLTTEQRLSRLEQQMDNIITMNLPQQVSDLQQEVAQLRGQLQVQAHDLKLLNQQQRSFYQDLSQQIKQIQNLNSGNDSGTTNTPPPAATPSTTPPPSSSKTPTKKSTANPSTSSTDSTSIMIKDADAYQAAFSLLAKRKYDAAKSGLQNYMTEYPNGQFVANATYWLGEIYLTEKNNNEAATHFEKVIKNFPKSNKVPDAKLKLAIIHANQGKIELAKKELKALKKDHPNTTAAQLADIRLQQLELKK